MAHGGARVGRHRWGRWARGGLQEIMGWRQTCVWGHPGTLLWCGTSDPEKVGLPLCRLQSGAGVWFPDPGILSEPGLSSVQPLRVPALTCAGVTRPLSPCRVWCRAQDVLGRMAVTKMPAWLGRALKAQLIHLCQAQPSLEHPKDGAKKS